MKIFILFFLFVFSSFTVFAQECPNGYCPPVRYDVVGNGDSVDDSILLLADSCSQKVKTGGKNILLSMRVENIKILWSSEGGQYVEGDCLIQYGPVRK